uniref:K Homology domain-containing protein n=1 Tax=Rhizochromulina marina TaxID=1034831 RepID=A0A7S2RT11_9STRA|mmetsp:Transcript_20639/g.60321  ORF Transcript_20639/g.60321 Transcript_20639/m.60321 type:complete len:328 (+) Transcript_20639:122-1105(+)
MATVPVADLLDPAKLSKLLEMHAGGRIKASELLKNALEEMAPALAASKKRPRGDAAAEQKPAEPRPPLVPVAVKGGFLGGVANEGIDTRETTLVMVIPHGAVKYVIGKGGASLRFVEQNVGLTQIKIQKDDHSDPTSLGRNLTLVGNTKACTLGAYLVMRCLHETCGKQIYPDWSKRAWAEANNSVTGPVGGGVGGGMGYRGAVQGPAGMLPPGRGIPAPGTMPNPGGMPPNLGARPRPIPNPGALLRPPGGTGVGVMGGGAVVGVPMAPRPGYTPMAAGYPPTSAPFQPGLPRPPLTHAPTPRGYGRGMPPTGTLGLYGRPPSYGR